MFHLFFYLSFSCRKVFVFIQSKLALMRSAHSSSCFHLYLNAAVAADRCSRLDFQSHGSSHDFPAIISEFFTQSLAIYDECVAVDSKRQVAFLNTMVGTLLVCRHGDPQDYDNLCTKMAQHAARLVRKVDQCSLLLKCAHLFFNADKNVRMISSFFK